MKMPLATLALISAVTCVNAQITLTQSDMPQVGDVFIDGQDTAPSVTPGASGAGQTWDFSAIKDQVPDTSTCLTPSATPYFADFPGANLAVHYRTNLASVFGYSLITSSSLQSLGNVVVQTAGNFVLTTPGITTLPLPATYLKHWTDTSREVEANNTGADSLKQITQLSIADTIDAWGTVKTPAGSFSSLRVKEVQSVVYDSLLFYSPLTSAWAALSVTTGGTKSISYTWYAASKGAPVLTLSSDSSNGHITLARYLTTQNLAVAQPGAAPVSHASLALRTNRITLETPQGSQLAVLNTQGRLMKRLVANSDMTTIDISSFPSGVYYFKVRSRTEMVVKK